MSLYTIPTYYWVQTNVPPKFATYLKRWSSNDADEKNVVQFEIHGLPHYLFNQRQENEITAWVNLTLHLILNFLLKLFLLGTSVDLSPKIFSHSPQKKNPEKSVLDTYCIFFPVSEEKDLSYCAFFHGLEKTWVKKKVEESNRCNSHWYSQVVLKS